MEHLRGHGEHHTWRCSEPQPSYEQRVSTAARAVVLTHGYCSVIALLLSLTDFVHFTLLIAEGRPDGDGHRTRTSSRHVVYLFA